MSRLKAWWSQPDQFDWITTFLRRRGLLRHAQVITAVVTGSAALVPLAALSFEHPQGAGAGLIAALTVGITIFWLTRWPTRLQSQVAVVAGIISISGWSLIQPTGALAILPCTAMAVLGGYIALLHSPKWLVFNGAIALAVATAALVRLSREADVAVATSAFWTVVFLNLSVPLVVSGLSRAMGIYAQRAEEDALTGLLNRRAFTQTLDYRVVNPPLTHTHLAVVMLDLDDFKRVNDTHGHSVGDHALRAVAELLREQMPDDAAICRAGGEEFLIALTTDDPDLRPLAEGICNAIDRISPTITASIGTASAELRPLERSDITGYVEQLIAVADHAMYAAKRSGGNQAAHHPS